jgi:hypothetical protein
MEKVRYNSRGSLMEICSPLSVQTASWIFSIEMVTQSTAFLYKRESLFSHLFHAKNVLIFRSAAVDEEILLFLNLYAEIFMIWILIL